MKTNAYFKGSARIMLVGHYEVGILTAFCEKKWVLTRYTQTMVF